MAIGAERAQGRGMFDYGAGAELYSGHSRSRNQRKIGYRRFSRAADAIQFAIETLPADKLHGAMLEVNEQRFGAADIRRLYDDGLYPLVRRAVAADVVS
jgi:hypothetical protein